MRKRDVHAACVGNNRGDEEAGQLHSRRMRGKVGGVMEG